MRTHSIRPLAAALATIAVAGAACSPFFMSGAEEELVGELRPNGSCNVMTSRGLLVPDRPGVVIYFVAVGANGAAPPGYVTHVIGCAPTGRETTTALGRNLSIFIGLPSGETVPSGRYAITDNGGFDAAPMTAGIMVEHPAFDLGTKGAGAGGMGGRLTLDAVSGEMVIDSVAPAGAGEGSRTVKEPRVHLRFRVKAKRRWGMG
jgi:hypothetical protein